MDAFLSRKRRRVSSPGPNTASSSVLPKPDTIEDCGEDEESTDYKLALLASLNPDIGEDILLETLLACDGSVSHASEALKWDTHSLTNNSSTSPRKRFLPARNGIGHQSSLHTFNIGGKDATSEHGGRPIKKHLTKKGRTLHLYSPKDVETHTPCSIIHNFLPLEQADALLLELLKEAPTFWRDDFKLFDRVVTSPHTFCFYVDNWEEVQKQKTEYVYNGGPAKDVRPSLPEMLKASALVQAAVNSEIQHRIKSFYPSSQKLEHQSPNPWAPNTAFVNCYDGPSENVGYHTDELTYLGPRAVIGSLSLGVAREFRIRKIVAQDDSDSRKNEVADAQGQISIHLPHNSLLVMHAEMQEEWKHSIAPARAIDPHPLAGNKRLNITYRCYRDYLHPRFTPKCRCGVATVLRCMMKKKESRGRYYWMCHTSYQPGMEGCGFFEWATFDEDGVPIWRNGSGKGSEGTEEQKGGGDAEQEKRDVVQKLPSTL